jgi:hypothetical protein
MPNTYELISSQVLASSSASITFSSIPATFTDIVLLASVRTDRAATNDYLRVTFNGNTSSIYSNTKLEGNGTAASSARDTSTANFTNTLINGATSTANTFTNLELYIPSYTTAQNKVFSVASGMENNATLGILDLIAGLFSSTAAISSMTLVSYVASNFVTGSSFYLYGVKNG